MNAVPVFVDIDPVTYNIDSEDVKRKITSKTKAIIQVHLYGQSADMDKIMEIASEHNLYVVEDGAQAIGTQYKDGRHAGTIGHIGCFSFFPSKNLGCYGDAGMIVTNDEELGEKIRILRVHGMEPKYYHKMLGGNFRIDAIQAAVLRIKLPHLDQWSEKRRFNASLYKKFFNEFGLICNSCSEDEKSIVLPEAVYEKYGVKNFHIYNQHIIRVKKRDELLKFLHKNEIGAEVY